MLLLSDKNLQNAKFYESRIYFTQYLQFVKV